MNMPLLLLSALSALALSAAALSVFALYRAHSLLREADRKRGAPAGGNRDELQDVRDAVEAMAAQIYELQNTVPALAEPLPRVASHGLNLSKRSQALRMHRKGENASQIASLLELPRQEVDLLLKVHRIVLTNV